MRLAGAAGRRCSGCGGAGGCGGARAVRGAPASGLRVAFFGSMGRCACSYGVDVPSTSIHLAGSAAQIPAVGLSEGIGGRV